MDRHTSNRRKNIGGSGAPRRDRDTQARLGGPRPSVRAAPAHEDMSFSTTASSASGVSNSLQPVMSTAAFMAAAASDRNETETKAAQAKEEEENRRFFRGRGPSCSSEKGQARSEKTVPPSQPSQPPSNLPPSPPVSPPRNAEEGSSSQEPRHTRASAPASGPNNHRYAPSTTHPPVSHRNSQASHTGPPPGAPTGPSNHRYAPSTIHPPVSHRNSQASHTGRPAGAPTAPRGHSFTNDRKLPSLPPQNRRVSAFAGAAKKPHAQLPRRWTSSEHIDRLRGAALDNISEGRFRETDFSLGDDVEIGDILSLPEHCQTQGKTTKPTYLTDAGRFGVISTKYRKYLVTEVHHDSVEARPLFTYANRGLQGREDGEHVHIRDVEDEFVHQENLQGIVLKAVRHPQWPLQNCFIRAPSTVKLTGSRSIHKGDQVSLEGRLCSSSMDTLLEKLIDLDLEDAIKKHASMSREKRSCELLKRKAAMIQAIRMSDEV